MLLSIQVDKQGGGEPICSAVIHSKSHEILSFHILHSQIPHLDATYNQLWGSKNDPFLPHSLSNRQAEPCDQGNTGATADASTW